MKYIYSPSGIKGELVGSCEYCDWKEKIFGIVIICSSGKIIFIFTHIEGITLGAGKEVDEVAGGAYGVSADIVGEVGGKASIG